MLYYIFISLKLDFFSLKDKNEVDPNGFRDREEMRLIEERE